MMWDERRLAEMEKRAAQLEKLFVQSPQPVKAKEVSAREFLLTASPKSDTQKVLLLGYFLEHIEGAHSFNVWDLEGAFRAAKEKLPSNMNDAVNKNIVRGFLMEAEEKKDAKKAWYFTASGE